ncbi:Muconate cycloisomerase [Rhodovulum sp. PH10]|uniref:N-acetyl-D-Glu racemase DgcA n=1 Tax=Rhodovulum sp. PH10 TaxID=1187851 RepID=UPI00027C20D6|nr:N-acetyl-D-Glu racemase DgcA [Rhodovulum sp. PH10]EJW09617.1 Muconate cycloisomerase [Rhodovulum sp. PH10]
MPRKLTVTPESWPIAGTFTISRGAKTEAHVVVASVTDGDFCGRGECVPYARYGESVESVTAAIASTAGDVADGLDRKTLQNLLPAGAARNALDCALIDLEAQRAGVSAGALLGLPPPKPCVTAYTISLGSPETMAKAAEAAADRPLLKVKLGGAGDPARIRAVREAAPLATLIVDANEAWRPDTIEENLEACAAARVALVEQPLPADDDALLATLPHTVPICADESVHGVATLAPLVGRYDAVNLKLDKTGGLTAALAVAEEATRLGFALMVGCMVSTSLSIAPALLLAQQARFVDLDGALLLARDRPDGLRYDRSLLHPATFGAWK